MKKISDKSLYDVADLFKVFADSTRIRILNCILDSEKSVGEIVKALNMNQSAVSHQLRILKDSKLIKYRRNGKTILYSLDDDHVNNIIKQGLDHVNEK